MEYIKLKELKRFKILQGFGFKYKRWNDTTKKYESSEEWKTPKERWQKKYDYKIMTDNGERYLELSSSQVGQLLELCLIGDTSMLANNYFSVRNNGKQGKEIRYFFNRIFNKTKEIKSDIKPKKTTINDINF